METLYDLLGALPRDDADELRTAFRRAVKGTHPDLHPGDPEAGLKFRQIVRASEILADQDQRAAYDHLLDLADQEQRQIKRHAVAHTIYQVTSGVIAFSLALGVIAGSYLAVMQLPDEWVPSLGRVATTMRQSTEAAASTLRQSRDAAVSALRQSTEAVSAVIIPSPPSPAMASTDPKIVETKVVETKIAEAKVKTAPPGKNDTIELPPEVTLPTVVTLQPEIGASPPAKVGPPLDITLVDARAYRDHGIVAYRNGDLDGAIADFDQAIQLDPKFSAAYIDRGIVFYRLRKFDRAFADIARAKRIEKTDKGKSAPASTSTTGQSTNKKQRPVVELGPPPPPQPRTANLDPSRYEASFFSRRP
jgi:tetratricopeptide (TPR) repeat protein